MVGGSWSWGASGQLGAVEEEVPREQAGRAESKHSFAEAAFQRPSGGTLGPFVKSQEVSQGLSCLPEKLLAWGPAVAPATVASPGERALTEW